MTYLCRSFPFNTWQQIISIMGTRTIVVMVDLYSHWPTVFMSEKGEKGFNNHFRGVFSTFGICQKLATDGASFSQGDLPSHV